MRVLREVFKREQSKNPQTQEIEDLESEHEEHYLVGPDGNLESSHTKTRSAWACGCFGPVGGRCSESGCGRINCARCFSHCGGNENQSPLACGKGLCREHAHYLPMPNGATVPFCKRCRDKAIRSRRWRTIKKTVLSLFIEVRDDE